MISVIASDPPSFAARASDRFESADPPSLASQATDGFQSADPPSLASQATDGFQSAEARERVGGSVPTVPQRRVVSRWARRFAPWPTHKFAAHPAAGSTFSVAPSTAATLMRLPAGQSGPVTRQIVSPTPTVPLPL